MSPLSRFLTRFPSLPQFSRSSKSSSAHASPPLPSGPDISSHSAQASRPATPIGADRSDSVQPLGCVAEQPIHPESSPSSRTDSVQTPQPCDTSSTPAPATIFSNESFTPPRPVENQNLGMFNQSRNVSATGNFIHGGVGGNIIYHYGAMKHFMEDLLKETIPGAAFDSSARDPPPRCHPGTRAAILERCLYFIANCSGVKKILWVVGAAGVGKSAIMQDVAESSNLPVTSHASVFLSAIGRSDGTRAVLTFSYQFAAKSEPYRRFIEDKIDRDPSLLKSAMAKQFKHFIVEPFVYHRQLSSAGRVLIIIDGLDECNKPDTAEQLLHLISDLCITHPSSPIVWLIASRPEQHITSFFSLDNLVEAYKKEEIWVDSDEACADVKKFLLEKLKDIQNSFELHPKWPDKKDIEKLADASGGLFAYADTAVKYIGDPITRHPTDQLSIVLKVIDSHPMTDVPPDKHPMARLDALYSRILSKASPGVKKNSRNILLALASDWDWALYPGASSFTFLCNWLGMTAEDAYAVINPLRSVFHVPRRQQAHKEEARPFHKSIVDYLSEFSRSKFSRDIISEAQKLRVQCALRISKQAPDGVDFGDVDYKFHYGTLARRPGTIDSISLTWPADETVQDSDDNETKLMMYKTAIGQIVSGFEHREQAFQNEFCIRLLIRRFQSYNSAFPYDRLRDFVFDKRRRDGFKKSGILNQVPLRAINLSNDVIKVKFRFRRPASTAVINLTDSWNASCDNLHEQDHDFEEEADEDWSTNLWRDCPFCLERLNRQRKAVSPDHVVSILFTSTGSCCVEFHFTDPEDGISEWTYWFWVVLSAEESKKYESIV